MGKMKKLYLTRRILAMILAVTMVVSMTPSTSLAAPGSDGEQSVEGAAVQATGETRDDSSADADDDSAADGAQGTAAADNTTAGTEDDAAGGSSAATGAADGSAGDDTADASGDNAPAGTDKSTADNSTPAAADDPAPAVEKPVYKIVTDDLETKVVYTGNPVFNLNSIVLRKVEEDWYEEDNALDAGVTYAWEVKGADGNFTAMAADVSPVNVGTYKLKLDYAAVTDVHDGAKEEVECEITKAPVDILVGGVAEDRKITVAPGTLVENVRPEIGGIISAQNAFAPTDITLEINGVRDAVSGAEVKAGTRLKGNGDYVMDITPSVSQNASAGCKAVCDNYELKPFTADIVVTDLINTRVEVTLAAKWDETGRVITKVYDKTPTDAPKAQQNAADTAYDYTYVVQYYDAATDSWLELKGADGKAAAVTGEWQAYDGLEPDGETGKIAAPTNAGEYYVYEIVYEGEEGVYAGSRAEITVEIKPAVLTVEATNQGPLTVLEGTTVQEVLSGITYKVTMATVKNGTAVTEDVTREMKNGSVWGTGYDDSNVSQIYEPVFTLQESEDNGVNWYNIEEAEYGLAGDKKYRVIYDGRKAIYNADGTFSHRVYVNDGCWDEVEGKEYINGVDHNYWTDDTPTAADKALAVTVMPGAEAEIDISGLTGDNKPGAKAVAELTAKEYDGRSIYGARSEYKNGLKLKVKGSDTVVTPLLKELTCEWYRYNYADSLAEAKVMDENFRNGFEDYGPEDGDEEAWTPMGGVIAPADAGIYKLVITYEDRNDKDGKLYYVREPAVVYYAIDPVQVKVVPKPYTTLEGRDGYELLGRIPDSSMYELQRVSGSGSPIVSGESVDLLWQVVRATEQEAPAEPVIDVYNYTSYRDFNFEINDKVTYELSGDALGHFECYDNGDIDVDRELAYDGNYTCYRATRNETDEANGAGKKRVECVWEYLGETAPITVKPMGAKRLTVEVDTAKWGTKEKTYDAKPFTLDALLADGVVTVKDDTGRAITGDELAGLGIRYEVYDPDNGGYSELQWITNVGEYALYAIFDGNETYAPLKTPENPPEEWAPDIYDVKIGDFKITQREISLKLSLQETYTAGITAEEILSGEVPGNITVQDFAQDDAWAFTEYEEEGTYYMWAWSWEEAKSGPSFRIYEKGARNPVSGKLTQEKAYEVRYDAEDSYLTQFYGQNGMNSYKVSAEPAAEFTIVKGNSRITSVGWDHGDNGGLGSCAIRVKNNAQDSRKREVTMLEGIGYSYVRLEDGTELEGNLAAFMIKPPAEYDGVIPDTAMYRNAVTAKDVNGYIVDDGSYDYEYDYDGSQYFIVVFDAAEGTKTFPIRWEDGYVETYTLNFDDAVKLGNLEEAVAPKALAFNAPEKKMAVGESQQLDVKITKAQMGDLICLGYQSSDESVLTVNENGYVTALKAGRSATITVFPQRYVKGKLKKIDGAKEAAVKITTTRVTAPKTVKAAAHGSVGAYVDLNYDTPKDGYRREIYVVDNGMQATASVKKPADFERLLAGTDENTWKENKWKGTFAVAPVYQDSADEALNRRRNGYTARLTGLETKGAYTVYVRNVCAARTLENGSIITSDEVNGGAAGTAVSFKTLKSEVTGLRFALNDQAEGVTDISDGYEGDIWEDDERYWVDNAYMVELSRLAKGTADSTTYGYFYTSAKDEAADSSDEEWIALPLRERADKDSYENPKLEYMLENCWNKKTQQNEYGTKNDIASIDKKGRIKITGMTGENERLIVRVRDTQTDVRTYTAVHILAQADSVAAVKKSVNLSVGERQNLGELLAYKMGKQKLTSYPYADIDLNAVKAAIKEQEQEAFFKLEGWDIVAIANGGKLTLGLTDRNVERDFGKEKATAQITFKTKALTAVKKVKAYDVIHDRFGLTFTYAGGADSFLVEVADANKTIYSRIFERETDYSDEYGLWAYKEYDSKGNPVKDTYRIDMLGNVRDENDDIVWDRYVRLTKETQYTVKVTALYDGMAAKPASMKVKTTKIPAVGGYIGDEYDRDGNIIKRRGGMSIQVSEYDRGPVLNDGTTYLSVLSGNSYTLTANVENRGRVNDTLVWTVDNAKVATVKAAAGSYCITLKGVKPGHTVLEVKSKIWGNKVVARYDIYVEAVGDAYRNSNLYFGENEPEDYTEPWLDNGGSGEPERLPLSVGDPRKVEANQYRYFTFTAPETGRYQMEVIGDVGGSISLIKSAPLHDSTSERTLDLRWLREGEVAKLTSYWSTNSGPGAVSYYVEVTLEQRVEEVGIGSQAVTGTNAPGVFKFTAPENARYQFSLKEASSGWGEYLQLYNSEDSAISVNGSSIDLGDMVDCAMSAGDSVWVKTGSDLDERNEYIFLAEKISEEIGLTAPAEVTVAAQGKQYLMLNVEKDGFYQFSSQTDGKFNSVRVTLQVNDSDVDSNDGADFTFRQALQADDKVCLVIENNGFSDYTFTVAAQEVEVADLTTEAQVDAVEGGIWQFTAAEAGRYEFSATQTGAEVYLYESASDAFHGENHLASGPSPSREMAKDDQVWMTVSLNGTTDCKLAAEKVSRDLVLGAATEMTIGVNKVCFLMFTVNQDGYYRLAATGDTIRDTDFSVILTVNGNHEGGASRSDFAFNKDLKAGDTVWLMITNSGSSEYTFSVKAEEVTIEEVPSESVQLAAGSTDTGYKFTAQDAGIYQFRMEASAADTSLSLFDSIGELAKNGTARASAAAEQDTTDTSKYICSIDLLLQAGETVYVNPRNESATDNLEVALSAGKKEVPVVTDSAQTINVAVGETELLTFTASQAGIYTFYIQNKSNTYVATLEAYTNYSGPDSDFSYHTFLAADNTKSQPLVLAAGQTIVWTIENENERNIQEIEMSASLTQELKEIKVGEKLSAAVDANDSGGTADGFVFRVPQAGAYTFWSETEAGIMGYMDTYGYLFAFDQVDPLNCLHNNGTGERPCLDQADSGGPSDHGDHFAMRQELTAGQTVYLKVIDCDGTSSYSFNVCVVEGEKYF